MAELGSDISADDMTRYHGQMEVRGRRARACVCVCVVVVVVVDVVDADGHHSLSRFAY